ncbi:MAG: TMCO1/EMC3 family protein [Candidatus Lokiarchaeota archaeon]|nr:TMCO1/EMC3 family protein [Candidatus Harpocratesius repetitus]
MTIAPPEVVWQIVGISLLMVAFSQWFSHRYAVSAESQMQTQMLVQDLQDQLRIAQSENNPQLIAQINADMMKLVSEMSKKQFLPMMIRSVVFFAMWGLMRLLYGGYDEYLPFTFIFGRTLFSLYLLVSFAAAFVIMIVKMIYKKLNPDKIKKKEIIHDKLRALQSNIIYTDPNDRMGTYKKDLSVDTTTTDSSYTQSVNEDFRYKKDKGWKERL